MQNRTEEYSLRLASLIGINTVSAGTHGDKDRFYKFQDALKEQFPSLFSACERFDFDGSMMLVLKGTDPDLRPVMLMNHHDVVEATGDWLYPPFSGKIADGKLYGRGTLDTKGGLFAMLLAADELVRDGFVPERDVYFVSTCNEETTGEGADAISTELLKRGIRFSLVLDEGGMIIDEPMAGAIGKYAMIGVGEKGDADLKFTARSEGGHASTPGKNTPLVRLGKFMAAAERGGLFKSKLSPTLAVMFRELSRSMKGPMKFILSHPRLFSPILKRVIPMVSGTAGAMLKTTVAFTMAGGSECTNVLPSEAWVIGNMRYSHHQGREESIAKIKALAKKYDIETEIVEQGFSSPLTPFDGAGFAFVSSAVKAIFPDVYTSPYIMTAASDSRYMARVSDTCLRFSPFIIDEEQMQSVHGINENVNVSSLVPAVDFYKYVIKKIQHERTF